MAKKLGIIKSISGSTEVIAVDKSGNQRVLKVGDSLYESESVKTTSADSKVVIATNNGKELSMIGEDTLTLDPKATAGDAQVAALQKALLNGANLGDLEETAAGGTSGGRAGDGVSLGSASFEQGGHYSNISASTSAINSLGGFGFASPETGVRGGLDNGGTGGGTGFYIDTTAPVVTINSIKPVDQNNPADGNPDKGIVKGHSDEPNAPVVVKDKDGKIIGTGTTDDKGNFEVTTDPIKPGDKVTVEVTDKAGNTGKGDGTAGNTVYTDTTPPTVDVTTVTPVDQNNPADGNPDKGIVKGHSDEPNAPVVVKDKDGKIIGTGTTDDKGNFEVTTDPIKPGDKVTVEVTDKAGNTGKGDGTAGNTVYTDTTPPTVDVETVTPVDVNNPADGKADKGVVTGKSDEPSALVVITDKDGNEIGRGTTDGNGGFTIETKPFNPGDPITATVTDKAGNKGSDTENAGNLTHPNDTTATSDPTITFVEDINPKDNKLNKAENGSDSDNANTTAKISIPTDAVVNDVIKYTVNGEEKSHPITDADKAKGHIEVKVPVVDGKTSTVTAKIVDQAGNASKEVSGSVDVDLTIGNPKVRFVEDTDGNGVLSVAEVAAIKDGKAHWVIDIPIDGSVKAGDVIQSIDSKGNWVKFVEITDEMIKDGKFEATFNVDINKLKDGKYETPEYRFADEAGNVSESSKASLTLDSEFSRQPSNPSIKFPEDKDGDHKISDKENKDGDKDAGKTTAEVVIPQDGSVKPGDKLIVTDDKGNKTVRPIEQSDIDKGSIDVPVDLNPGKDNTIIAEIVNPNNPDNPGKGKGVIGENSEATKAPEAPVITDVIDDVKGGKFNEDVKGGLTNDNTPTIKGTAKAGSTVVIYDNDVEIGKIEKAGANWEFTTPVLTKQGEHKFTAIAKNEFGTSVSSNEVTIDLDTKTDKPAIKEIIDDVEGDKGDVSDKNGWTNDNTPTLKGSAETGADVDIYVDGKKAGSVKANDNGEWEYTTGKLSDGKHSFYTIATDEAGNVSENSEIYWIKVDTNPGKVVITSVTDDNSDDVLNGAYEGATKDNTPTINGFAEPYSTVTVSVKDSSGKVVWSGEVYVEDSLGDWSITVDKPLNDGDYTVEASMQDYVKNPVQNSNVVSLTIDNATDKPVIKEIIDDVEGDTGDISSKNNWTNDNTPTLKGSAEAGADIKVFVDGKIAGTTKAGFDGSWEFTPRTKLSDGDHTFYVEATDKIGNTNTSDIETIKVDTNPGKVVITSVTDDNSDDVLNGAYEGATKDNTPTINGFAEPYSTVTVSVKDSSGKVVWSGEVYVEDSLGDWSITVDKPLNDGDYTVEASMQDYVKNPVQNSNVVSLTVDTATNIPEIKEIVDNVAGGVENGDVKGKVTNDNTPTLKGSAEAGADIKVFVDGKIAGTTKAGFDGSWEFTPRTKLGDGEHKFVVEATDKLGHSAKSIEASVDVDTTIGNPKVRFLEDTDNNGVLSVAEVAAIKDGKAHWVIDIPTDGSIKAGDVIQSIDSKGNWVKFVTITDEMIKDGRFEATFNVGIEKLRNGKYETPEYRFADDAGNISDSSKATLTLDGEFSRTPGSPLDINFKEDTNKDGKISNKENQDGDKEVGKTTAEISIPKDGSVKPGDKLIVKDNSDKPKEHVITEKDIAKGKVEVTVDIKTGDKTTITAEIVNPNNPSKPSEEISKDITEASSTVQVTIDEIYDDVAGGVVNGDVKNGLTNDNLPTFKGSAAPGATVEIYESFLTTTEKTLVGKTVADANGKWSFTPTVAMSDGLHYFEAVATDSAGNKSFTHKEGTEVKDMITLDVDTSAEAPVIDAVNDNVDSHTGNVLDAKTKVALTNDSTPTLEGYAEPNSAVTIYEISELNGEKTAIKTVTADEHGGWKFELPELGDGEYKYTTRAQDKAGNISDFSETVIVNVDLVAPTDPTITFVEDINPKDGKLNKAENGSDSDNATTTAKISVPGDAVENDVIHYTVNGEEKTHTITYNDRVAGYIEVKVPVVDGKTSTITAKIVDQAGNASKEVSGSVDVDLTIGNPKVRFLEDTDNNGVLSVAEVAAIKDGKAHWVIDIPTDGSIKAGDVIQSIDSKGNWVKFVTITDEMIKDGRFEATFNVGIEKLRNGKYETPEYRFADDAGNISDSSKATLTLDGEFSRTPGSPLDINFKEDTNKDGKISNKENQDGDKEVGKTTAEISIPKDGSVKPGDKLIVKDNSDKPKEHVITEKDIAKGKVEVTVDIKTGDKTTITAEIVNPNNPSKPSEEISKDITEASSTVQVTIDEIYDDVAGGVVNGDVKNGLTNDNLPTFKGSAAPGATVEIYESFLTTTEKTLVGKTVADANGKWSFTPTVAMSDGLHYFEAVATDSAGNKSFTHKEGTEVKDMITLDVDTSAEAPVIDAVNDNVDSHTGNVLDAKTKVALTNDSTPTLEGYAEPNSAVTIYEISELNGEKTAIKTVTADEHGGWKFELPELGDGEYKYTTRAQDKAGNISDFSETVIVNVDLVAPTDPTITFVEDINPKDGKLNKAENGSDSDNATTTAKISVPGDAVENDVIHYTVNGEEKTHTITYNDRVAGYIEVKVPVVDGKTSTITAKIVDQAGNASKEVSGSVDVDLTVDAPKVRITADADDNNILSATEASALTDGKLKWVIKLPEDAKEGDRIEVSNSHREWVTVLTLSAADVAKGEVVRDDFSADFVKGRPGFQTPSYRIVDQAGNISAEGTDSVRFDKTAPKAPVIKEVIDDHKGYDDDKRVGDVLKVEGGLTNDNTPTIKGTAEAGIKVDIYDNGKFIGTTKADNNGNWDFTPSTSAALPDGKHSITAVAENALGVKSASSNAANIDVDTVTPKPTIDSITDNVEGGIYKGDVKGGLTNDNRPVFEGKAEKGAFIELFDNDKVIGTTKAGEDGKWTIQPKEPMADGKHNMVVQATDLAGNRSRSDQTSSDVDTTSPGVVKITAVCDDVAGYNGKVGNILGVNNGLTDDSTPTIKGTAKPGVTITIKDGDKVIDGDIKYNGDGSWEFTPKTPLAEGKHELTAIATSKTGVVSNPSNVAAIDVDTKIADAKVEFIEDTNNDGKFSWKENVENPKVGRLSWKALIPDDGSIKAGDIFHYKWDETGWHERAISQAEIDRGYIGEMKNNQIDKDQPDAGKPMPYGKNANGSVYVAEAFFSDAAGNKGAKGSDKIVFDFSDSESGAKTVNVKITSIDDNVPGWNGKTGNIITNEAAHIAGLTNDNTPTISGTTEAGAIVKVSIVNGKTHKVWEGDVKANENGEWSITTGNIADGKYSVVAVATDKSGVASSPYTVSGLEIDATVAKPNILVAEDRNHDGFYDNVEYYNPANGKGDITFVVEVPKDGSIKAGDTFHYTLNTDYKGWSNINGYGENITISQTDIDNGSFSRVVTLCKDNQHFDLRHDGATVSMKGQFKDLAGNALADETSVKFDLTKVHSGKVRSTRSLPDDILDNDSVDLSNAARINEPKAEPNVLNNNKIGVSANDLLETPKDHIMNEGKSEAKPSYATASSHAGEENIATTHPIQIEEKVENHF